MLFFFLYGTSSITYRIIEVTNYNGSLAFRTKGDANDSEDIDLVTVDKLIGIYSFKISGLGNVAMFMSTTQGLIICVIVPLILLIGFDFISRKKIEKKNENDREALMAELEKLRSEKKRNSD
mgnify:FL=1